MDLVACDRSNVSEIEPGNRIVKSRSRPLLPLWLCSISVSRPMLRMWWFHVALNGAIGTEDIFHVAWDSTR